MPGGVHGSPSLTDFEAEADEAHCFSHLVWAIQALASG